MTKLTSIDFYNTWKEKVTNRKEEMLKVWRKNKELTLFIKGSENSIIDEIANHFGLLSYEQDYYSIDAILYEKDNLTPKIKANTFWFRDIKVAFEHENNFKSGLYQEISHLLITNCELKVLVAYPDYEPDNELEYLHEIIKGTRHSKELSEKENFLIIFGYETGFEWEGYIYKENNWKKIIE
ncbi:hypothetical protein FF125_09520 [Aureibaculum algae]|uniref:Uncharacterized protein n=1 Tax=Aureibaculum algae TaxID=2584122 RepID=A0A5B7TP05_9FLAO|nr:hypothetical protein [Aureibaculum algae]QCX38659.1 hypothetical protein FF125_09520 [Aureibaculum algae]